MKFSSVLVVTTLALQFAVASSAQAGSFLSRLAAASPSNLSMLDDSREFFFDANLDGFLGAGDALVGYAKVGTTTPPSNPTGNTLYAVFSQTFATFDTFVHGNGDRTYSGTFMATPDASLASLENLLPVNSLLRGGFSDNAIIAIIDRPNGSPFSADLEVDNLPALGGVGGAITSILDAEGTVQLTAGVVVADDFFAFQTSRLNAARDFVAGGIAVTATVPTSVSLGRFGAGLSVTNNYLPLSIVNRVIESDFAITLPLSIDYGIGKTYDVAIVNGNFGGIFENPGLVQGGGLNFINNADLVVNITVLPEPTSIAAWGVLALAGIGFRRRLKA